MAKKSNGIAGSLEQALALLIQNQATFVQNQTTFLSHLTETYQRLARIEGDLDQIKAILLRHEQTLQNLPKAIRQEIGFKTGSDAPPRSSS